MSQEQGVQGGQPVQGQFRGEQVLEAAMPRAEEGAEPALDPKAADEGVGEAGGSPEGSADNEHPGETMSGETMSAKELAAGMSASELVRVQEELAQARDQALRAAAELQNVKRRARVDVEKAHKFALEKMVSSLLPVADSLENGLKCVAGSAEANDAMREGMELTLKLLVDALGKQGVAPVDPEGQALDPNLHQAVTMVPSADKAPNTVIETIQKGYTLNGRVVRPAMVVVAKSDKGSEQPNLGEKSSIQP